MIGAFELEQEKRGLQRDNVRERKENTTKKIQVGGKVSAKTHTCKYNLTIQIWQGNFPVPFFFS